MNLTPLPKWVGMLCAGLTIVGILTPEVSKGVQTGDWSGISLAAGTCVTALLTLFSHSITGTGGAPPNGGKP